MPKSTMLNYLFILTQFLVFSQLDTFILITGGYNLYRFLKIIVVYKNNFFWKWKQAAYSYHHFITYRQQSKLQLTSREICLSNWTNKNVLNSTFGVRQYFLIVISTLKTVIKNKLEHEALFFPGLCQITFKEFCQMTFHISYNISYLV